MIAPCLQTTGIENGVCQYSGFSSALGQTIIKWTRLFNICRSILSTVNAVYADFKFVTYLSTKSTDSVRFTPSIDTYSYSYVTRRIRIDGVNRRESVDFVHKYVTNLKSAYTAFTVDGKDRRISNKHAYLIFVGPYRRLSMQYPPISDVTYLLTCCF